MAWSIRKQAAVGLVPLCMIGAGAGLLWAGPLNPPSGPISSGGKTTQEIFDAVTGISNSIGGSGRGPGVPGSSVAGAGTLALPAVGPFGAVNVPLIGLRLSISGGTISSNGQIIGNVTLTGCTLIREVGAGDASELRLISGGYVLPTSTVVINAAGGGVTTYTLTTSVISGLRSYSVQRADGTYASIQEVDLGVTAMRVTEPGGATWQYNFVTHTGGG